MVTAPVPIFRIGASPFQGFDFNLLVSNGDIGNLAGFNKSGFASAIPNASEAAVQDLNVALIYPASAIACTISSGSANDTAAGTGARTVKVTYLTTAYALVTETLTMSGQTGVALSQNALRVLDMEVMTAGSGGVNAGIIYVGSGSVTTGVPAVAYLAIAVSQNKSQNATYTVPANSRLFLYGFGVSTTAAIVTTCRLMYSASAGGILKARDKVLCHQNTGQINVWYQNLYVFDAGQDIEVRAQAASGTADVSAYLTGYLQTLV